jgi:hypothetical protein
MHAEAIDRLSGKRDKAAATQTLGSARQRAGSGVTGSTRITSVIASIKPLGMVARPIWRGRTIAVSRCGRVAALVGFRWSLRWPRHAHRAVLHGENETEVQAQRRIEALDATDLINRLIDRRPRKQRLSDLGALGKSPMVNSYRGMAGKRGDLVRKIRVGRR